MIMKGVVARTQNVKPKEKAVHVRSAVLRRHAHDTRTHGRGRREGREGQIDATPESTE